MSKKNPQHILKGLIYLDLINLEEKLSLFQSTNSIDFGYEYFIDLSQVRFAELSATAQLLLRIESYLKKDFKIFIALPTVNLVEKEKESISYSEELKLMLLNTRKKTNNFLKTIGFVKSLKDISYILKKEIYITEDYNFEKEFNLDSFQEAFSEIFEAYDIEYDNYRYVFPFEWINCKKGIEQFSIIEKRLDNILENPERGLEAIDVLGIKNVVISELVKNVIEHSKSEYALFSIGLFNTQSLINESRFKKTNPIEKEYIEWLKENTVPTQVEIIFGDSGCGILTNEFVKKFNVDSIGEKLNDETRLQLAFQKWTTLKNDEPRRGTKGLYRIQRIVNKYNGLFHITTSAHNGGFRKGGLKEEEWLYRKVEASFEGTIVQIKLCPYADVKKFRYVLKDNNKRKKWKTVQYNPNLNSDFLIEFKKEVKLNDNLLVILNLKDAEDQKAKDLLEICLPEFSYDSHPCAVVLYILSNLKNDTIQTSVESANAAIINNVGNEVFQETSHKDAEEVYDPVLVIGEENHSFWYGGNQNLIELLNESHEKYESNFKLSQLEKFNKLSDDIKIRIRLHLENDNKLVNVDRDEHFTFNFTNINKFFENEILSHIKGIKKESELKYCSPKLEIVDNWINVKDLLKNNEYGYALTLYLKYKTQHQDKNPLNQTNDLFILIDHKQQKELAKAFATLLGINHKNIKSVFEDLNSDIPKRTKLFPENSNVIVLTTIISSSETIRRLVKYIKRDSAFPEIILCLCNYRKYNISKLETWNAETTIDCIYKKNLVESKRIDRNLSYYQRKKIDLNSKLILKSPVFEKENEGLNYKVDSDLKKYILENKVLHYNHIGIYRHRHFTFYLDKIKLLDKKSFIWDSLKLSINNWETKLKIKHFTLYVPKSLFPSNFKLSNLFEFLKTITKNVIIIDELPDTINAPNVIYFDFGMITGKSINSLITKCKQVENLFICILFNQSNNNEFEFYQRIKTLNNEEILSKNVQTNFNIEYLYRLPLGYFNSESCPICEHIRALDYYKLSIDYMFKFSEDRQRKLKLIESDEIQKSEYPFDFYYSTDDVGYELSSELIMKMYEFKILLENAEVSTKVRIEVYNYLFDIYINLEENISDCNSSLYSTIYYLSHEINWLQKEPLIFRDFRNLLSVIAHKIAVIDRDLLALSLEKINKAKTTSDKLAIRYKYSAISLLRSTNKLLFCESISEIVFSAKNQNSISDNIVQNALYHITSLYKNKYNRSKVYFENIQTELDKITSDGLVLNIDQKLAIQKIDIINKKTIKEIEFQDSNSEYISIKNLKNELLNTYSEHHPKPIEFFHKIYLHRYNTIFKEYEIYKENARNYSTLFEVKTKLVTYWKSTLEFINNSILFYLERLDDITISQFYRNNFSNFINSIEHGNVIDRFTKLVYLIEEDLNNYNLHKKEYDFLYENINNLYIKADGQKGEEQNSKILNLISHFPTNIYEAINTIFPQEIFMKRSIYGNLNVDVFYPKNEFLINLDLVKNNIDGKKNDEVEFKDIAINFELNKLDNNYSELIISYDSTEKFSKVESQSGSLSNWKREIEYFKGSLFYDIPKENSKFFVLKLKILNYE